jgi:hypothetical protein
VETLDEEVAVQRVAVPVVTRIVGGDLGEGDVADHQVERAVLGAEILEPIGVDGRPRSVEVTGDLGGGLVELDAEEARLLRGEAQEVARPAARLEHPTSPVEAKVLHRPPHRGDDRRGGVVGVERGSPGLCPRLVAAQQTAKLVSGVGEAAVGVVEDLRDRTPTRPAGEHLLLGGRRPAVLALAGPQDAQGGEVGVELRSLTRRSEVTLAGWPEGRVAIRRYGAAWSASLIAARSR